MKAQLFVLFAITAAPAYASDMSTPEALGYMLTLLVIYFAPWLIAVARRAKGIGGIVVVNLFLGWTLLGWVGALAWAAAAEKQA